MENPAKKSPLLNYRRCLSPYLSPFRAFSTAFFITILEFVAPDTASTSMLCPSAILPAVISAGFPRRLFIVSHAFQINRRKNHAAKEKNAYGKQKEGTHIFSPHKPSSLAAMERYTSKNPYSKNSFFDKPIDFFMYSSLLAASRMIPESIPQQLKNGRHNVQIVPQIIFLQMPQINAVFPQIIFLYGFNNLIKRRNKGFPILRQGSLEQKCV